VCTDRTRSPSAVNGFICLSPKAGEPARAIAGRLRRGSLEEDVKARGGSQRSDLEAALPTFRRAASTRPAPAGPGLEKDGRVRTTNERASMAASIVEPLSEFRNRRCRKSSGQRVHRSGNASQTQTR